MMYSVGAMQQEGIHTMFEWTKGKSSKWHILLPKVMKSYHQHITWTMPRPEPTLAFAVATACGDWVMANKFAFSAEAPKPKRARYPNVCSNCSMLARVL